MKKVMVGMSGGVDSSVSALILVKEGYEISGVTLKQCGYEDVGEGKRCCNLSDVFDAKNVAAKLGIKHYVFNYTKDFDREVIEKFIMGYKKGETPNPCLECNREIKFKRFLERAIQLGYDGIATGHYARIEYDKEVKRYKLKRAADERKDQTYFLYTMTQEALSKTEFPLGRLRKTEVRQIAEDNGLINARKHDSQDICFVQGKSYSKFIEERLGYKSEEGDFIDTDGRVLGKHKGIMNYTIGQRKGLGISFGRHMYVVKKNAEENTIVLGEERDLYSKRLVATGVNLISIERLEGEREVTAKTRYSQKESKARIRSIGEGEVEVLFDEPQRAISPGQAVVFYEGEDVLGGGTIKR